MKSLTKVYHQQVRSDELAYVLGVVNIAFSAWLAGAYPQCFWIFHAVKLCALLSYKLYLNFQVGRQYFLLDYCYTVNYWSIIYYALCICKANIEAFHNANALNFLGPIVFRCLFTVCIGPLAASIILFKNSLVLHDWNRVAVLAVHWSPNIALWGMRWWPRKLEESFPDTFHFDCENVPPQHGLFFNKDDCVGTFVQLWVYPLISYIVLWAIPYYLFFFVFAKNMIERNGFHTMYEDMKISPILKPQLEKFSEPFRPLIYMCCHGTACSIAFLLGPLLWHSFALHTIWLMCCFGVAIYNGSTFYFEVFAKKYYKAKMDEAEKAAHANEDGESNLPSDTNKAE